MRRLLLGALSVLFICSLGWADVPDSMVVQGRAATPLATIAGTATVKPAGNSQAFSAQADANGVFQFTLTGLSTAAFQSPDTTLELAVGTATISIPLRSVPFALRSAQADSLAPGATAFFQVVNVTTLAVTNMLASSATFSGQVTATGGLMVGSGSIHLLVDADPTSPWLKQNVINFTNNPARITSVHQKLTLSAQGNLDLASIGNIQLYPGGYLDGTQSATGSRRIGFTGNSMSPYLMLLMNPSTHLAPPLLRFQLSDLANNWMDIGQNNIGDFVVKSVINSQDSVHLIVKRDGSVGLGTDSPTAKLHVNGSFRLVNATQGSGKILTSNADGLASWQSPGLVQEDDGVVGNEVVGVGDESLTLTGADTTPPNLKLKLNVGNKNTWSALQTFTSGIRITAGVLQTGKVLTSDGAGYATWQSAGTGTDADAEVGNEVVDAGDSTLSRTATKPYKLTLNLDNANNWTGLQTFSGASGGAKVAAGAAFEVAGSLKVTSGVLQTGKVLTSDGAGLATWQAPAGAAAAPDSKENLRVLVEKTNIRVQADYLSVQGAPLRNLNLSAPYMPANMLWYGLYVVSNDAGSVFKVCVVEGTTPLTSATVDDVCGAAYTKFRRVGWANANFKPLTANEFMPATKAGDWWWYDAETPNFEEETSGNPATINVSKHVPPTSRIFDAVAGTWSYGANVASVLVRPTKEPGTSDERPWNYLLSMNVTPVSYFSSAVSGVIRTSSVAKFDVLRGPQTGGYVLYVRSYYDPI